MGILLAESRKSLSKVTEKWKSQKGPAENWKKHLCRKAGKIGKCGGNRKTKFKICRNRKSPFGSCRKARKAQKDNEMLQKPENKLKSHGKPEKPYFFRVKPETDPLFLALLRDTYLYVVLKVLLLSRPNDYFASITSHGQQLSILVCPFVHLPIPSLYYLWFVRGEVNFVHLLMLLQKYIQ